MSLLKKSFILVSLFFPLIINCSCKQGGQTPIANFTPSYVFTQNPIPLTNENGEQFYLFGDFPQSKKLPEVRIFSAPDKTGYYVGEDGNYYAKVENELYKVEPILWKVIFTDFDHDLNPNTKGKLYLLAQNILISDVPFSKTSAVRKIRNENIQPNNYEYSTLRSYLNQDFLNSAFSKKAQKKILTTTVDNSALQMTYNGTNGINQMYVCHNTKDKVFAPSIYEMISMGIYNQPNKNRILTPTDYALANNCTQSSDSDGSWWLLRSPNQIRSVHIRVVRKNGEIDFSSVLNTNCGVVPGICINATFLP